MLRCNRITWVLVLAMGAAACGADRQAGWERQGERVQGDFNEVLKSAHALWEQRADPAKLDAAIDRYEKAAAINPQAGRVMIRLARAYYFLADGYHRDNRDRQLELYDEAASWGERAMGTNRSFLKQVRDEGVAVEDALHNLDQRYVGAVYWSASAIGKWARLKGFTTLLSKKGQVKKFMEWVTETDPDYYYGGPDRYWGAFYSIAPSFAGGDLDKSKTHYEASLEIAPDYLGTKVLMADTYATKTQDRELFERLLNEVIEADPAAIPAVEPELLAEQEKARELLAEADELFAAAPRRMLFQIAEVW